MSRSIHLNSVLRLDKISIIPQSIEKYTSTTIPFKCELCHNNKKLNQQFSSRCYHYKNLKFIDSLNFLASSLDNLVKNLSTSVTNTNSQSKVFNLLYKELQQRRWESQIGLFNKKLPFPYEFLTKFSGKK